VREILISAAIFLSCLVVAFLSQVISPSDTYASGLEDSGISLKDGIEIQISKSNSKLDGIIEIDPDDPNPKLFIMAKDTEQSPTTNLGNTLRNEKSITTASGLKITELVIGKGAEANPGNRVSVNYKGSLTNGQEFDSSYGRGPFSFPLGAGQVIKGWDEGVSGMKIGGKRQLVIPPELGYGSRGAGGVIPPNATLVFEVELLEVN
tara:strand:+ start:195 stop:812 length:618 start_codon:yes stop_codon:yes gene_type:complete